MSAPSDPPHPQPSPPAGTWWIIWGAIGCGLIAISVVIPRSIEDEFAGAIRYLPLLPLAASAVVRWVILPRTLEAPAARAFVLFVAGLALAEGSGIMGIVLGGPLRDAYLTLALLGLAQFAPFFAR